MRGFQSLNGALATEVIFPETYGRLNNHHHQRLATFCPQTKHSEPEEIIAEFPLETEPDSALLEQEIIPSLSQHAHFAMCYLIIGVSVCFWQALPVANVKWVKVPPKAQLLHTALTLQ
ncbi:hypothetical protein AUP42_07920 [Thalassospira lucentensis]|uniref:Uncharacterized protein n=1 Tax=Thalassospira lucentensis TaxID=168935 RepID=A0A154KZS2_9PROT|nr:hypothetical protein AUP42_07920 [Thalassospira lucentensis]